MANNRINFSVGYTVDKTGLQDLKQSLQEVQKAGEKAASGVSMEESLKESCRAAQQLESILDDAWNSKLGELNLSKVNQGIKTTFGSVSNLKTSLEQSGKVGKEAYSQVATAILNTNLQLKESNKLLDDMATSMANTVKWGITSSIFNNLTGSIQKAFYFVKDLDSSLNDIRIVTNKSTSDMEAFAESANRAAKALGAKTTDFTEASLIYYQQGLSDEDVATRAETTLKAANVTGQSAEEVSELLTAVWNGYKVSADEAELYIDKIAAVAATTASDLEELSTGMSKVASAANLMGVDIDQLNAQLATIVSVTRQAPESVGTALKTIYARMGDIEAGLDEEVTLGNYTGLMADMGFNVLDMNGKLRDMGEVIEEIGGKWVSLSREQQIALAQTMAGTRQYNNLLSLFDNWDMYTNALQTSAEAAGTLQEQQDTYMERTSAHLIQLQAEAERTYNTILDKDTINTFIDILNGGLTHFNDYLEGLGGGLKTIATMGTHIALIFSKQIADSILKAKSNIDTLKANANAESLKEEILKSNALNGGVADADSAGFQAQLQAAQDLIQAQKGLTQEQYNETLELQKQIGLNAQKLANLHKIQQENESIAKSTSQTNQELKREISAYENLFKSFEQHEKALQNLDKQSQKLNYLDSRIETLRDEQAIIEEINEKTQEREKILTDIRALEYDIINALEATGIESAKELDGTWIKILTSLEQGEDIHEQLIKSMKDLKGHQEAFNSRVKTANDVLKARSTSYDKEISQQEKIVNNLKKQNDGYRKLGESVNRVQLATKTILTSVELITTAVNILPNIFDKTSTAADKLNSIASGISTGIGAVVTVIAGPIWGALANAGTQLVTSALKTTELWEKWETSLKTTEELLEENKQRVDEIAAINQEFVEAKNSLAAIGTEFEILAAKAGTYGETMYNLSEAEQARYYELLDIILQYNSEAVLAYDAEGHAIVNNNNLLNETIKILELKHKEEMKAQYSTAELEQRNQLKKDELAALKEEVELLSKPNSVTSQSALDLQSSIQSKFQGETLSDQNSMFWYMQSLAESLEDAGSQAYANMADTISEEQTKMLDLLQEGFVDANGVANLTKEEALALKETVSSFSKMFADAGASGAEVAKLRGLILSITDEIDLYIEDLNVREVQLKDAMERYQEALTFDAASILGWIQNDETYNQYYQQLEEKNVPYINKILLAYLEGTEWNLQNTDLSEIAQAGTDFTQKLAEALINNDVLDEYLKNPIEFTPGQEEEYKEKITQAVNSLLSESEQLKSFYHENTAYQDIFEDILANLLSIEGLDVEYNDETGELVVASVVTYTDRLLDKAATEVADQLQASNTIRDTIREYLAAQYAEGLISDADLVEIKSKIIMNPELVQQYEAGLISIDTFLNEILKEIEQTNEETAKAPGLLSTVLNFVASLAEGTADLTDESEENAEAIEYLTKKYKELGEYRDTSSKEYLDLLKEIREKEEDAVIDEQERIIEEELAKLEEINQGIENEKERLRKEGLSDDEIEEQVKLFIDQNHLQSEIDNSLDMISNANYEIKVAIDADLKSDVEDAFGLADEIHKLQTLVNQELKISIDEAQEIMNSAYAGMLQGAQATAEGMILLDENVVRAFITGKESEIEQDKQAKIEQLQHQRELLAAQLNILYTKQDLLSKASVAETSQKKGEYLAQARMEEENYQNSVKIMQGELEADGELNKALSENAQNLYNALGGMYEADADNMASAARSADYNANNLFNNIIQYANASTNAINTVTTAIRWIGKKYATITSWGVARKGTGSSTANSGKVTSGFEVTSTGINAKDTGLSEAELNSVFDEVIAKYQQETSSQISNLLSQIGSIDAGIAALQTSSSQLQDYKANLGKPIETSSSNKKGSSGSGNKGSSGTGASSKDSDEFSDGEDTEYLERFKAEIDLYHDINIILGNIEEQLAKINKEQEKLTGADLIASLQKEAKLLEQQVVALENKVLLEEIEAMQLQNALKQQGVKFNQEGDISNYAAILKAKEDYVNNIISKYNYMTEEEQEAYKDTVDQAQEDYDAFVETIQRYEEIMNNEIPDLEEQIQDAYNRQIEIQITQFDTKIQASLDLSEAEREWNEFKKKIIEGMDDEDIFGNAVLNFDNLKTYFADTEKSIPTLTQGLNQIIEDLKIINEGGEGSIFGDDEAAAVDSLKSYYEELMNGMEEVDELVKEIQQSYLDMLDEADEKFSKQIEGYEHIADIMNHGMNLTGLLYGDEAFAQFEHYYEQLAENNKKNLDFQRQEVEHWYKIMQSAEEGSDAWEKAKENFQDATAQLNSTVESAIENILNKYENAINQIFKNWEQNLTGGMSLDYLEEEWNLINDNADDYLDKVNAAYEIRQLERKYQEAIDGTSSLAAQQKLNDLMTEELQMLQTKDKLSEYDVERANLKYQIALKELALDDAKKNKSQMRLRRDSQGNYSYQYVSDDTEISNAVDELEQLRNSLYNLDKNQLVENQNNILSSEQELVSKLKDLYINYNVANIGETEEYLKQKELLEQQYQQKINNLLLENSEVRTNLEGSALEELAYMHGVNIESFQAMADAEREILMNQLIPQWDIGIADMISRINGEGGIAATMEELFIQLEEAVIQYGLDVRETLDAAGTSIDGYQGSIESLIDLNQELLSSNDDLIDSYEQQEKAILDLIESLKDLQTEYKGVKDEAIDALNAANALIMLQNKEAAKAQSNTNSKKPSTNSGSNGTGTGAGTNIGTGTGGLTAGDIFSSGDTKKPSSTNKNNTSSKKTESGDGTPSVGDKVKYISGRYYYDSTGTRPTGSQFQGEYVYITALNEKGSKPIHISTGSSLGNGDLGWLEKSQISGYDTGGYTGDWTGDKGRLALLHKKELVLKDTDTSNILDAVKIIRSINEVMFRNISSLATNIGTASSSIDYADKNINQNVTIHAEFPGVSFAKEIEDAFSNLTNVASQHAYK